MTDLNSYEKTVVKSILACKEFGITEVKEYECIKSMSFNQEQYDSISSLIKEYNWKAVDDYESSYNNDSRQYLEIVKFSDQNNQIRIATLYDSDELWQDPQVIQIF